MTFTYTPASPTDITRVRYAISDTVEASAGFTDEEIQFVINEESSWQKAAISLLEATLRKLSIEPDFRADWLQVDGADARKHLRALIGDLRARHGIAKNVARSVHTYRADSLQTEAPDYTSYSRLLIDEDDL